MHQSITYDFFDIYTWVAVALLDLDEHQRTDFLELLSNYVNHPNTAVSVKTEFKSLVTQGLNAAIGNGGDQSLF